MPGRRFEIDAVFRAIDRISRPMNRMRSSVGRFTRKMQRGMRRANRAATKVSRVLSKGLKVGFVAATAGALAFSAAMRKIITVGAGFEKTIVSAAVKFPGKIRKGTEAFKELESAARGIGKTTEFTASQTAGALNFLAMAGFGAEQAIGSLSGVVDLATVADLDLARATDIASDSLGALGLATKDTTQLTENLARVNDVFAATSTSANTTVEDMFEALVAVGPVATDAGASVEMLGTLIGELANAGIKGSKAGIHLKGVFLGLTATTPKAAKTLRELGIKVEDSSGNMRDAIDVVGDLKESLKDMGNVQRAAKLKAIFGKIPIASVNVLLKAGAEKLKTFRGELEKASGTSAEMAAVMRDTTQGSLNNLTSAVEGSIISMFKLSDKGIDKVVKGMTNWVRANEGLIASKIGAFLTYIVENFDDIVKVVKRLAITIGIIYGITTAIKAFSAAMEIANLIAAANPWMILLVALVALATAIYVNWDDIKLFFKWTWEYIVEAFEFSIDKIKSAWDTVTGFFMGVWNEVVLIFEDIINSLITTGPISWIIAGVALIMRHWDPIVAFFAEVWGAVSDAVSSAVSYLIDEGPIRWIIDIVKSVVHGWGVLIGFFVGLWDGIVSIFNTAVESVGKPLIEKIGEVIDRFKSMWEGLKAFFSDLWVTIKSIFNAGVEWIKDTFSPVMDFLNEFSSAKDKLVKEQIGAVDLGDLRIKPIQIEMAEVGVPKAIKRQAEDFVEEGFQAYDEGVSRPQLITPQERIARSIEERSEKSTAQVTIRDETGRAEVTEGKLGPGVILEPTGTF